MREREKERKRERERERERKRERESKREREQESFVVACIQVTFLQLRHLLFEDDWCLAHYNSGGYLRKYAVFIDMAGKAGLAGFFCFPANCRYAAI